MLLAAGGLTASALLATTGATSELAAGVEYALNEVVETGGMETGAAVCTGREEELGTEDSGLPEYTGRLVAPVPEGAVPVPIGPAEEVALP